MITLTGAAQPRWATAEAVPGVTAIDCRATFAHLGAEAVPFTASPNDPEAHGRDLYARLVAGEFGPVAAFTAEG